MLASVCFMYMAYWEEENYHVGVHYPYSYFFDFALIHAVSLSEKQKLGVGEINTGTACIILF